MDDDEAHTCAAVVLAAGGGRRFGGGKQVAVLGDRPLVVHAVDTAVAAGLRPVVVVTGGDEGQVAALLSARDDVTVVHNPAWASGQASSLRRGLDAVADLTADAPAAVVLLADQPGLDPAAVRAVAAAALAGAPIARARYADGVGHPVALSRSVWDDARRLQGDTGARALFDAVEVVDVPVAGRVPHDVDRPEDLARLAEERRSP